jgi:hypothetical protein
MSLPGMYVLNGLVETGVSGRFSGAGSVRLLVLASADRRKLKICKLRIIAV